MSRAMLAWCARQGFPLAGRHILCAVSGGVDSMTLLHLLWQLREQGTLTLTAATFDHRLRPASGEDAAFVVRWCGERGIPCRAGAADVAAWAAEQREGLEQAGRTLRYQFLEQMRLQTGAELIATAHNANDNAETLLLHLLRGSGLRGLGGIPPRRGAIVRPLLWMRREEIAAYAAGAGLSWREDESNRDIRFARNALRHQVMPLLEELNPNLVETLSRTAERLRRDDACLSALVPPASDRVEAAALAGLPEAVSLRLVQAMAEAAGSRCVLRESQREAVLDLARGERASGTVALPGGLTARRRYEALTMEQGPRPKTFTPVVLGDGEARYVPELDRTFFCRRRSGPGQRPGGLYLRWGGTAVTLRPRQTGDRITLDRRGTKSLKKWMIEEKIPRDRRGLIPVAEIGGEVAALWGMGRDRRWLPEPDQPCWELWTECGKER